MVSVTRCIANARLQSEKRSNINALALLPPGGAVSREHAQPQCYVANFLRFEAVQIFYVLKLCEFFTF
jgi:hypothetical protein